MNSEVLGQIYNLIKEFKSDVSIDEAIFGYNHVYKHPYIIMTEKEIEPLIKFVSSRPDLIWFIDNKRVSQLGQQCGTQIRMLYPDIEYDVFMALMMGYWKEILTKFAIENGYTTINDQTG